MATYEQEKYFFKLFLKENEESEYSSGEQKLINLIMGHFDAIVPLGTAGGKRAEYFAKLIQTDWIKTPEVLDNSTDTATTGIVGLKQLKDITMGDFRAFSNFELIDLNKKYTFIYGPNGSGKSSFFEAIEYCLLGDIQEANSRKQEIIKYIKNLLSGRGKMPVLRAVNQNGDVVTVTPSRSEYQFCFVEKNRIDSFARIGSQTTTQQINLLATLFGLDLFNKFVEEFTENIETRVKIVGVKEKELRDKQTSIKGDQQNKLEAEKILDNIQTRKNILVQSSKDVSSYEELISYVNGTSETDGQIKQLERELEKPIGSVISALPIDNINEQLSALVEKRDRYLQKISQLQSQNEKESFLKLYEAVIELQPKSYNYCPACKTPIKKSLLGWKETKRNPYDLAKEGIIELQNIKQLKEEINRLKNELVTQSNNLNAVLMHYVSIQTEIDISTSLFQYSSLSSENDIGDKAISDNVEKIANIVTTNEYNLIAIYKKVALHNQNIIESEKHRNKLRVEKEELQKIKDELIAIETEEKSANTTLTKATSSIEKFNIENETLLKEVDLEKPIIEINIQFVAAYKSLIPRLTTFKNELPSKWVKDINSLVKEIYNLINEIDPKSELIGEIKLPQKSGESISIAFQDDPTKDIDALYILSEGHLRCLGFAILVAKNIIENKPLIIMDDIVNAIDDDHRAGIRRILFQYDKLKDKQVILTSHSEEFIKDTENNIPAIDYGNFVKKITFQQPNNRQLRLLENDVFNYLIKSKEALDKGQKRNSLAESRRALENLAQTLWKKLGKDINASIQVSARPSEKHPELMTIVNGLSSCIEKKAKHLEYANNILPVLSFLRGLETKSNVIWNLLNAGTHEEIDRDDFDQEIVKEIIQKLIEFDTIMKS